MTQNGGGGGQETQTLNLNPSADRGSIPGRGFDSQQGREEMIKVDDPAVAVVGGRRKYRNSQNRSLQGEVGGIKAGGGGRNTAPGNLPKPPQRSRSRNSNFHKNPPKPARQQRSSYFQQQKQLPNPQDVSLNSSLISGSKNQSYRVRTPNLTRADFSGKKYSFGMNPDQHLTFQDMARVQKQKNPNFGQNRRTLRRSTSCKGEIDFQVSYPSNWVNKPGNALPS